MDNLLLEDGAIELVLDAKTDAVEASRTAASCASRVVLAECVAPNSAR